MKYWVVAILLKCHSAVHAASLRADSRHSAGHPHPLWLSVSVCWAAACGMLTGITDGLLQDILYGGLSD